MYEVDVHGRPLRIASKRPKHKIFGVPDIRGGGGGSDSDTDFVTQKSLRNEKMFAFVDVLSMADPPSPGRGGPNWFSTLFDWTSLMSLSCVYVHVCVYVCVCMFVCLYVHVYVHLCVCVYVYVHVCVCMCCCSHYWRVRGVSTSRVSGPCSRAGTC